MVAKQIKDFNRFYRLVAFSLGKIGASNLSDEEKLRWLRAIARAVVEIQKNGELLVYDAADSRLVIWSPKNKQVYSANDKCQCKAFLANQPCWHRAGARLFRNFFENQYLGDRSL